jgi:hypothetical protein
VPITPGLSSSHAVFNKPGDSFSCYERIPNNAIEGARPEGGRVPKAARSVATTKRQLMMQPHRSLPNAYNQAAANPIRDTPVRATSARLGGVFAGHSQQSARCCPRAQIVRFALCANSGPTSAKLRRVLLCQSQRLTCGRGSPCSVFCWMMTTAPRPTPRTSACNRKALFKISGYDTLDCCSPST